jgi:hypothetical protein
VFFAQHLAKFVLAITIAPGIAMIGVAMGMTSHGGEVKYMLWDAVAPHAIERLVNHVTGTLSPISLVHNRARHLEEIRAAVQRRVGRVGGVA